MDKRSKDVPFSELKLNLSNGALFWFENYRVNLSPPYDNTISWRV